MKLAIMQPYFMPYIGYFQAINAVDKYILYDNLTFIKDGWINRNRIRLTNGNVITITVPLINKSSNLYIRDILIDNSQPWKRKFMNSIKLNYAKAPFFYDICPMLDEIIDHKYERIVDLNTHSIITIAKYLDINTIISSDNSMFINLEEKLSMLERGDYSLFEHLKETYPTKKVARVIEMCKAENSDFFVNAIGGQKLYDKKEFARYNISLNFIKTNDIFYKQFNNIFEPNLSIIDVLMFNGKDGTKRLLNEYTFV